MRTMVTQVSLLISFFMALTCQAGTLSVNWEAPEPISIGQEVGEAMEYFESVDLGALSQKKPLKAAAVLRAAACLERAKRAAFKGDRKTLEGYMRELAARINVLRDGRTESGKERPFELLNLTSGFDAQVVVDFPAAANAEITLYYGALPLLSAEVSDYFSPEVAAEVYAGGWLKEPRELRLGPYATRVVRQGYMGARYHDYDPGEHYLYVWGKSGPAYIFDAAQRPPVLAEALLIAPGCSAEVAGRVKEYLENGGKRDWSKADRYIVAGPLDRDELRKHASEVLLGISSLKATEFYVQHGARVIGVQCSSAPAAERIVSLIIELDSVTEEDVEFIRREVLAAMSPQSKPEEMPGDLGFFVGETHSHTFYSDGNVSPQGLTLQAIGTFQDFLVISDHNTIDGALLAGPALRRHGFVYDVIVGEELTTADNHFNAYPVKKFISPELTPDAIVREGHLQGAVVQWNHPGWPDSAWASDQYPRVLEGTDFDAWEHAHWRYPAWRRAGKAPVITGSTDTHDGLFNDGERTGIFAAASGGSDLAEAIRSRRAVAASSRLAALFMGDDAPAAWATAMLRQAPDLRNQKLEHLRAVMKDADVAALLKNSRPDFPVSVKIGPIEGVKAGDKVRIEIVVADIWHKGKVKAVVSLAKEGSSWQEARKEVSVSPGRERTVILKSRVKGIILPLPAIQVDFYDDTGKFHSYHSKVAILPDAPEGLRARAESSGEIELSWTGISGCGESYTIERKTASGEWRKIGTGRPDLMVYYDGELEPQTEYAYRVQARTLAGSSGYSRQVSAKTPAGSKVERDDLKEAVEPQAGAGVLPRADFRIWHVGSEETAAWPNQARLALDGDPETFWHTQWAGSIPPHPHEFQVDLGKEYSVSGIRYLPRQDGNINGTIGKYRIYVSDDGRKWGNAVARGAWENNREEKQAYFPPVRGRYVRLVADSEVIGQDWTSANEIYVIGK